MKRLINCAFVILLCLGLFVGCQGNIMSQSEKLFIKTIDKSAGKLDLNADQKVLLERLKMEIRKNFLDGQKEKEEAAAKIKEERMKENPDTQKMSSKLEELLRNEMERINRAFHLTLNFQSNLNDDQKKRFSQMISKWVTED
jgi:hypothetical protein